MSFHVYIAREGLKGTPIPKNEWVSAILKCEDLFVEEKKNKKGTWCIAKLKSDTKQSLDLTSYGLVHTQNPSKALVETMIKLAPALESKVYSERNKVYESVADWEKRTKNYWEKRQQRIKEYKRNFNKQKPFWVSLAILLGILIWIING